MKRRSSSVVLVILSSVTQARSSNSCKRLDFRAPINNL
ncbi:hypothetical protein T08_9186 [Trichinella sp. T8]|nr:hypothetical protein T08_9186 [Trichinella sp. T8]